MLIALFLFAMAAFFVFIFTYADRKEMKQKEKFISQITSVAIDSCKYKTDYQKSDMEKLIGVFPYGEFASLKSPINSDVFYCGKYVVEVITAKCVPFISSADTLIHIADINGNKTTFSSKNGMLEYPTSLLINKFYPHRTFINLVNDKNPIEKIMCEVDSCQIIPAVPAVVVKDSSEGIHNVTPMVGYEREALDFKEDFDRVRFELKYAHDQYSYRKFYCGNYLVTVAIFKGVRFKLAADTMIVINTIDGNNILVRNDRVQGDFKDGKTPHYLSANASYPLLKTLFKKMGQ